MTAYATQAASALATLRRKGAAVTFTLTSPGTKDATTETYSTPTTASVAGYAIEVASEPEDFEPEDLIQTNPVTLLFAPSTVGDKPARLSAVTWASVGKRVSRVRPVRPDGTTILARVGCV